MSLLCFKCFQTAERTLEGIEAINMPEQLLSVQGK
jgi:hypothetical protein